jgi:hypothetical protein
VDFDPFSGATFWLQRRIHAHIVGHTVDSFAADACSEVQLDQCMVWSRNDLQRLIFSGSPDDLVHRLRDNMVLR